MTRTPLWNMRLDPDRKKAWEAAAAHDGVPLSVWVTRAGDAASDFERTPQAPSRVKADARYRTSMCEHRVPPGVFCKNGCDT